MVQDVTLNEGILFHFATRDQYVSGLGVKFGLALNLQIFIFKQGVCQQLSKYNFHTCFCIS